MNRDHQPAQRALRVTRVAPLFDRLVDTTLSAAVQQPPSTELTSLRERLDRFFPEFRELYFGLLEKHIGARLPSVLEALDNELVQTYFKALKAMEPELLAGLQELADRMAWATTSGAVWDASCPAQQGSDNPQLDSRAADKSGS